MKYAYTCPKCKTNQVYKPRKDIPKDPHTKCPDCGRENHFKDGDLEELKSEKLTKKASTHKRKGLQKPTGEEQPTAGDDPVRTFIDDPNELLMSNAIRALNKQNPHVSWGTLL
ncbi:hypothetical protein LCGC14_1527060, partial [marine sediment metagenome]